MPVGDGNLLRSCRDTIPQRLHEIDSFIDGKLVESWRRRRDWFGHISHLLGSSI
jgi:hypothetical protein